MNSPKATKKKQGRTPSLSQAQIIDAALVIVREQDIEAVSFRRLAQALDVSAMAIYRYYDNKNELLSAMLDRFIAEANVLPNDADLSWQQWLREVAKGMYEALISTPSWLPYLGQLPLQDSGLEVLDACLGKLQSAGFSQEQSSKAFFALLQVLFGAAIAEQQLKQSVAVLPNVLSAGQGKYPNILGNADVMADILQLSQIDIGLNVLIAGLEEIKE